jgi:hypothetical protein
LYGLLVYDGSDHRFPDYMAADGLTQLHSHAGKKHCALFVIHSPSQKYIDYAQQKSTLWAQVFNRATLASAMAEIPEIANEPILDIDGERRSIRQLLTPSTNEFLLADEIQLILRHFDCQPDEHPCLIFFTDLNAKGFWFVNLTKWVGWSREALEVGFRDYFQSKDFSKLAEER